MIDRAIPIGEEPSEREEGLGARREVVRLHPEPDNHQRPEDRLHRDGPKGDRLLGGRPAMRQREEPLPEAPALDRMVIGECRVVEREQQQIRDDDDPEGGPARRRDDADRSRHASPRSRKARWHRRRSRGGSARRPRRNYRRWPRDDAGNQALILEAIPEDLEPSARP